MTTITQGNLQRLDTFARQCPGCANCENRENILEYSKHRGQPVKDPKRSRETVSKEQDPFTLEFSLSI